MNRHIELTAPAARWIRIKVRDMAYDEQLAGRVRELMEARPAVTERKMFGGIGWTAARGASRCAGS
jgi:hypothetical protein